MAHYSDVTIGGLFPVSLYVNVPELHYRAKPEELRCTGFDFRAFRWLQTMIFTIEEINKDPRILPNITLGYRVYDTCDIYSLRAAMTFLSGAEELMSNNTCRGAVSVPAIIGEAGSLQSSIIASTTGPFQIPIISYFSTCTCLSDRRKYPAFFRTAPSDYFQTKALAQLVKHFGWTWIGAFGNDDDYGRFGIQQFIEQVTDFGACVAFSYILPKIYDAAKISQMVNVIKRSSAKVIIVFTPEREMLQLIEEIARQNVTGIQWLASEAWVTGTVLYTEQFLPYLEGTIGFSFRRAEIPGLREFLLQVKPSPHESNNYVNVFWEELFACKFKQPKNSTDGASIGARVCTGSESLGDINTIYSDTSQLRVSYSVYKGVYAIAHALHRLSLCESGKGPFINSTCASIHSFEPWQLLHYLKEVRFTDHFGGEIGFDENGDAIASYDMINCQRGPSGNIEYVQVGRFDAFASPGRELSLEEHSIVWTGGKAEPPWSACSESCPPGMRKASRNGEPLCCFDCVPCAEGEISNATDSVECKKCSSDDWSSSDRTVCIPREIEYLSFEDGTGMTLAIIALLGACLTVAMVDSFVDETCELREMFNPGMIQDGDVILGGLFAIHLRTAPDYYSFRSQPQPVRCVEFSQSGLRWALTMVFAIEEINRNPELLPDTTLGYKIFDSCDAPSEGLKGAFKLLKGKDRIISNSKCAGVPSVSMIVGDGGSSQSIAVSRVVAPFAIDIVKHTQELQKIIIVFPFPKLLQYLREVRFTNQFGEELILRKLVIMMQRCRKEENWRWMKVESFGTEQRWKIKSLCQHAVIIVVPEQEELPARGSLFAVLIVYHVLMGRSVTRQIL
ncbi:hypothetical protein scyTo_0001376 [Scyliorhinus torazame]|uniref:G-protein coupled receptors family 3 profile domain-containing protein n=1 Tax=Scyliorhinus torazame TaxID=75743 RepID=A0A401PCG1_SCYTO|nr:hypothetical protein [Scyliorhinus torazame]